MRYLECNGVEDIVVKKLRYGNTNTFLICGTKGNILVDTDYAGTLPLFYKEIKKHIIEVKDITYVLATHYHPDHIGLVSELMKQGVKLILIDTQRQSVHFSDEIFRRDKRLDYAPIKEEEAILLKCEESRDFLRDIGIEGEIISTPSHSDDSISVMLDNGDCFVGDLEPVDYLYGYEGNLAFERDWTLVMSYRPKVVYYAHANEKVFS